MIRNNVCLSLLLLLLSLAAGQPSKLLKRTPLDLFSFDYSAHTTPIAFSTHEATVELMHKTKLIPRVKEARGGFFLSRVSLPSAHSLATRD